MKSIPAVSTGAQRSPEALLSTPKFTTVDEGGVALAAIQGLHQVVQEKQEKIAALERRLDELERLVTNLAGAGADGPRTP